MSEPIFSDDPKAVEKIKARLVILENTRAKFREINKIIKGKKLEKEEKVKKLLEMGFSEERALGLFEPDFCGRIGIPDYEFANRGANIRRLKERVKKLSS